MTRKKTPPPKIVELPKRDKPKKVIHSDDWLELSSLCQEMALHARDVELLAHNAEQARKYSDSCLDNFVTAKRLRDAQQEIFFDKLKEIFG